MAVVLVVAGAYGLVRFKRAELVDFVVPRTAAVRFLAHEPRNVGLDPIDPGSAGPRDAVFDD
jgi:hypothetical protein